MGCEGKGYLYNYNCVALETAGMSRKYCRDFCVTSFPCSLLPFSSRTPVATFATKVHLMGFLRAKKNSCVRSSGQTGLDLCLLQIQTND